MGLFWEGLLTLLAVLGLAVLGYILFGRLLHPIPGNTICILLMGSGKGERLEGELRSVIWLRSLGLLRCPVVLADTGLDDEGIELTRRLTQRWSEVYFCPIEKLGENLSCLKRE